MRSICDRLDRPAFNRTRLKAEKSIGSRVLEQSASKRMQIALNRNAAIPKFLADFLADFLAYFLAPNLTDRNALLNDFRLNL